MMTAASKLAVSSEIPHMDTQLQENYQTQQLLLDEMDKYSQTKIALLLVDSLASLCRTSPETIRFRNH